MHEKRSRFIRVIAAALPVAVASLGMVFVGSAQANATTTDEIVAVAHSQIGVSGSAGECNPYGPCEDWCALFAEWVWRTAGVSAVPSTGYARGVGAWGVSNGSFIPVGSGSPEPGDLVVYGPPQNVGGGHVAVVEANNGDGTIETIDGNDGNAVRENPRVSIAYAKAGSGGYHISGFVRPQNVGGIPFTQSPGDYDNGGLDDLSGDHYGDLLFTDAGHNVDYVGNNINGNPNHQPYYGSPNGTGVAFGVPVGALTAAGDVSGDGYADLLDYDPSNDTIYYYPNNINAGNGAYATGYPVGSGLAHVAGSPVVKVFAADITGDGHADLEYLTAAGDLWYIPNDIDTNPGHTPYYVGATKIANGLQNAQVTIGDITGDHYADLVYYVNGQLYYVPNNILSDGVFYNSAGIAINTPSGISNPTEITASDVTGDGYASLLWANANGDVGYLPNNTLSNADHGFFETPSQNVGEIGPGSTLI